jgi:RNA polymerase sigma-70 factor (ECF subfamily)
MTSLAVSLTGGSNPPAARLRRAPVTRQLSSGVDSPAPAQSAQSAEPADVALVAQIAAGDADAVAVLYHRHGAACYRLARHITVSTALAEDAVQEAFTGLWRSPASYLSGRGSVRSWLLALTHNKAVDLVRREAAERRRQEAQAVVETVAPRSGPDAADVAWSELQAAEVRAALLELSEPQRQAVTLAYFGGYSQSQIAELTGVPLGTIKTRTLSAMRRLRLRLAGLNAEESR